MNVLVSGGAGYVGSHAARMLANAGHEVWAYDNLVFGHRGAVAPGRLIEGDLLDRPKLEASLKANKIDAVMHFAAFAYVGESVTDPGKYYHNNVVGTLSLMDAMRAVGVRRIVFSSTCATYGEPESVPIRESQPQNPINPYGYTKLVIERALADYAKAYKWGYAALRYFNASGASADGDLGEDHDPETHLIPLVLQVALGQREHITIFGDKLPTPDGTCIRDYIHVDDLASAHISALERLEPGTEFKCNLGTGQGTSVKEVVDACRRITGHAIPAVIASPRAGDPPALVADASLARRELGWTPRFTSIAPIVESAWRWHQKHPNGYGD
ncbi:MAG: UDP-glucose 4-epimerase GalE [Paludisphaera borealis]|uniref:UDP-glucose 4-epimerase GalE n=1 Tax=Paludisphaera borealis TaxID=1387353 RepID=UPI00284539D2|nr:UDP-glucose 4-epimerase GalE [Paludisphaera borealis]MDR3620562.1 UDP-glucose 4-epimerase GalE [Paludisphaera borealis]